MGSRGSHQQGHMSFDRGDHYLRQGRIDTYGLMSKKDIYQEQRYLYLESSIQVFYAMMTSTMILMSIYHHECYSEKMTWYQRIERCC